MDVKEKLTKEKRRNTEKRKEKSRFAARCRRSKESEIFSSLASALPLEDGSAAHLDKATVMRLVIAHLRLRNIFKRLADNDSLVPQANDKLLLKAIGGIILIISAEGDIVYVSPNVSLYLGISEVDLIGQNLYDVCHPCDHKEVKDILSGKCSDEGNLSMFLRMKCTLTSKGRNLHIKSASYKVLHIVGTMIKIQDLPKEKCNVHFAAIGSPIPHPANIEIPLGSFTFLSKHSLDMKYTYADERMKSFLGYSPDNLIGKSLYEFHHVLDNKNIQKAFKSLFAKGQSETDQYRFLAKGGGYVWVYTQATVIYREKGNKPESVVCVNYIASERCNEKEIYSSDQLRENLCEVTKPVCTTSKVFVKVTPPIKTSEQRPQLATLKIFAPRTPDMNKGFLTFADDDSGSTILKDEPEDLTHLAPTAGDTCVPLETSPYSIIVDDINVSSSSGLSPLIHHDKNASLFVPCIDDASSCSLSPSLTKSPGACSLPSLCSLRDDSRSFEGSSTKPYVCFDMEDNETDDLSLRSPYISMSEGDDLPLLMTSDLPWSFTFSANSTSTSTCSSAEEVIIDEGLDSLSCVTKLFKDSDLGISDNRTTILDSKVCSKSPIPYLDSPFLVSVDNDKRKRTNSTNNDLSSLKKRRQIDSAQIPVDSSNSVLMNLLAAGPDISSSYATINTRKKTNSEKFHKLIDE